MNDIIAAPQTCDMMTSFHKYIGELSKLFGLCGVQNTLGVLDQAIQNAVRSKWAFKRPTPADSGEELNWVALINSYLQSSQQVGKIWNKSEIIQDYVLYTE